jgi:hypothetical protein
MGVVRDGRDPERLGLQAPFDHKHQTDEARQP